MGMPCEVNSILKLRSSQGYPQSLKKGEKHKAHKNGYRIIPVDIPILLVDDAWLAHADIRIFKLTWENGKTAIEFEVVRVYHSPFLAKDEQS